MDEDKVLAAITVNMMAVNVDYSKRNADRAEVTTLVEMVTVMHRRMRRLQTDVDDLKKAS